jgi:hypothetical protein
MRICLYLDLTNFTLTLSLGEPVFISNWFNLQTFNTKENSSTEYEVSIELLKLFDINLGIAL